MDANDIFISYSRRDKEFAQRLEKALEDYYPPKDLDVPHRNLNVFRDEADFTGVEYTESIERHLRASTKMILICSPHARNSSYVNDEVRRFVAMKGANNVIPILLSGIPNNEARPGQEYEKAFPDSLLEVMQMPLAVSYVGFDSKRDRVDAGVFYGCWCTILADIYGLSRSEIEQREKRKQARARLLRRSVGGAVIVALSVSLGLALVSRQAAIKQRQLADEQRHVALKAFYQLTYMVPQELAKFSGTGQVRERVVRDTIATLQELQKLTPDSSDVRRELATNHRLLGTTLYELGKLREAGDEFKASAGYYDSLLQHEPTNALWHRDLSVSLYNYGLMMEKLGEREGACQEYMESLKWARKAVALDQQWAGLARDVEGRAKSLICLESGGR